MLKFLKSLFEKTPVETHLSLRQDELLAWIENREKEIYKETEDAIISVSDKMNKFVEDAQEHLKELKVAELKNKDIPKRAIQIMQGNREAYISKTRMFLDKVDVESYSSFEDFIENFNKNLEMLGKSNSKSNYVLGEFFSDITRKIAMDLKNMEKEVENMKKVVEDSGLDKIRRLKEMAGELNAAGAERERLAAEIDRYENEMSKNINQKEKVAEKLSRIRQSSEYKNFENLKKDRDSIINDIKKVEDEIIQIFGQLESGLKKYARIAMDEKTVKSYLDDPGFALKNDSGLKVLEMIKGLKKNIEDGTIEMKEKKKEKTLLVAGKLDRNHVKNLQSNLAGLAGKKRKIEEKIHKNSIMSDYNEQEYMLNHIDSKIKEIKKEKKISEDNLKKADIGRQKDRIAQSFESDLKIILDLT